MALIFSLPDVANAQKKPVKKPVKPTPVITASPQPTPAPVVDVPMKRNERPAAPASPAADPKSNGKANITGSAATGSTVYSYEFLRPGFTYPQVLIEHNENGKGKISFKKDGYDEFLTDPVSLSPVTIEKLKAAFTALNFLESSENYQYVKDFSNMGNVTITLRHDGKTRTAKFNWTENKNAKVLFDEYRRVSNEYTWKFEITVGRENQPLQTPGMMDALDSYIQRDEISDPLHLVPFLTELSNDERLPLIARNRALKLIKQIGKVEKK